MTIKKLLLILSIVLASSTANARDWMTIQIFACEPEWGSLAKEIVGDKAKIMVATNQFQNPHFVMAKPSLISEARQADLIFCSGADLEVGWLPVLLEKANKLQIKAGGAGYLMASDYVKKLEMPTDQTMDRAKGDIHPFGNPHVHLNPNNIPPIAAEFLKRIIAIDHANAATYQTNYDQFIKKWNLAIVRWEIKGKKLKNMPIAVSHNHWAYLVDWLGLKVVAKLEEKPGVAPSTKYLFQVLGSLKANPVDTIIYAPFEDKNPIFWLSERAVTRANLLPFTINGTDQAKDLFELFDNTLDVLIAASGSKKK